MDGVVVFTCSRCKRGLHEKPYKTDKGALCCGWCFNPETFDGTCVRTSYSCTETAYAIYLSYYVNNELSFIQGQLDLVEGQITNYKTLPNLLTYNVIFYSCRQRESPNPLFHCFCLVKLQAQWYIIQSYKVNDIQFQVSVKKFTSFSKLKTLTGKYCDINIWLDYVSDEYKEQIKLQWQAETQCAWVGCAHPGKFTLHQFLDFLNKYEIVRVNQIGKRFTVQGTNQK